MELNYKVLLLVLTSFGLVCGECLNGFLKHDDMCYHISHDTETWIDALVTCDKLYGAQLVEIETAKENDYLVNKTSSLRAKFWVGGNDLQVEGQWKWATSNEDVQFTAWGNHPSNSNRNENCMEIAGLTWNDNQCDRSQRYICEKPLNGNQIIG